MRFHFIAPLLTLLCYLYSRIGRHSSISIKGRNLDATFICTDRLECMGIGYTGRLPVLSPVLQTLLGFGSLEQGPYRCCSIPTKGFGKSSNLLHILLLLPHCLFSKVSLSGLLNGYGILP